jgi:hypothetical protein
VDADLLAEDNAQLRDLSSALPLLQAVGATLRVQVCSLLFAHFAVVARLPDPDPS